MASLHLVQQQHLLRYRLPLLPSQLKPLQSLESSSSLTAKPTSLSTITISHKAILNPSASLKPLGQSKASFYSLRAIYFESLMLRLQPSPMCYRIPTTHRPFEPCSTLGTLLISALLCQSIRLFNYPPSSTKLSAYLKCKNTTFSQLLTRQASNRS